MSDEFRGDGTVVVQMFCSPVAAVFIRTLRNSRIMRSCRTNGWYLSPGGKSSWFIQHLPAVPQCTSGGGGGGGREDE